MAQIVLHIGTHKTGTTSIQHVLAELRPTLLEQGVLYPAAGFSTSRKQHSKLAVAIAGQAAGFHTSARARADPECWNELQQELDAVKPRLAVVSSEEFAFFTAEQAARVAGKLQGHDVRVLIYLRNQWDYMVSFYKEVIHTYYPGSMQKFLEEYRVRCDYAALLDAWLAAFGSHGVSFRLFDKVKSGLIKDFLQAIGLEDMGSIPATAVDSRKNTSGTDAAVRVMRLINWLETPFRKRGRPNRLLHKLKGKLMRGRLERLCRLVAPLAGRLYSERDKASLRDTVAEYNTRFFKRLSDPADMSLFAF